MRRFVVLFSLCFLMVTGFGALAIHVRGAALSLALAAEQDDDFDDLMDKAKLNYNRRNYEDALKFYKRANKMKGDNCPDCLWGMAQTYSKLGADKNVIETCDRLVPLAGDDKALAARAHNLKGITLADMAMEKMDKPDLKKLAEAESAFRQALAAANTQIVRYNLGVTLIRLNRDVEGIQELKAYIEDVEDDDSDTAEEARKMIANPRRARENFAPDFTLTTSEGEYIDSEELRGKVLLLDFWGTWCGPCRESVPALASLAKKFSKEPFLLLSVDVGDETSQWRAFIEKNKMTWPQHQDRTGKVQRLFQVRSFPTYVLIDHEGIVRYRSSGYSDYVEGMIADAIKKSLKTAAKAQTASAKTPAATAAAPSAAPASEKPKISGAVSASVLPAAQASPAPAAEAKKPAELLTPVLEMSGVETMDAGGMRIVRFYLTLKNWSEYPDEFFSAMPDLPPCSFNTTPTRIQVIVWSDDARPLTTYCSVPDRGLLRHLQVMSQARADAAPMNVYVTIEDRRSQRVLKSNLVPLTSPAGKTQ